MHCPECEHPIPYVCALAAGSAERPVWCGNCGAALKRPTCAATYIYIALSLGLGVFAAAALGNSGFVIAVLLAADLIVDWLTIELVPLDAVPDRRA